MKKSSLLIIEDHQALRSSLSSWLTELFPGITIYQAATGKEGLKLAQKYEPELALIDIGLPDISGIEVTKYIKEHSLNTDVIILTMLEGQNYRKESLSAGAKSFVHKKEMYSKLPQEINSFLSSK